MTYKVGPKGQVVLPKAIRERLDIQPGDEVEVEQTRDGVLIRAVERENELFGSLGAAERDPLLELEAEHRRELERDSRPA